ncbi:hypothetical protein, partial [Pseudoduganella dura]|uniref:hypothetical protein n=1 Tax=Pseudoduganella dura TaxID=321982 RepID=UPI001E559F29
APSARQAVGKALPAKREMTSRRQMDDSESPALVSALVFESHAESAQALSSLPPGNKKKPP